MCVSPIDSINELQASHNTVKQDIQKIQENTASDGKKCVYSVFTTSLYIVYMCVYYRNLLRHTLPIL